MIDLKKRKRKENRIIEDAQMQQPKKKDRSEYISAI